MLVVGGVDDTAQPLAKVTRAQLYCLAVRELCLLSLYDIAFAFGRAVVWSRQHGPMSISLVDSMPLDGLRSCER